MHLSKISLLLPTSMASGGALSVSAISATAGTVKDRSRRNRRIPE